MAVRLAKIPATMHKYTSTVTESGKWSGNVVLDEVALYEPLSRKKPTMYFVNSMSDLFHENVPFEWVNKIMAVIAMCPQHTFQVLTKRPDRMRTYFNRTLFPDINSIHNAFMKLGGFSFQECWNKSNEICENIITRRHIANLWLGVSVEDQATANDRVHDLMLTPAAIRFLSCEPLLGKIDLTHISPPNEFRCTYNSLNAIHWVIVGGESGHGSRPMHPAWVRSIQQQCQSAGLPFFFKQWGDYANTEANGVVFYEKVGKSKSGCLLDGKEYKQFPNAIK